MNEIINKDEIKRIVDKQKDFFKSGKTLDINYRIMHLKRISNWIKTNEKLILEALYLDLGKSAYEAYMTEIREVLGEIDYQLKHIKKFSKKIKVKTPLSLFPAKSFMLARPLGTCLIIAPWNYPFLLVLSPLIDALSAGNNLIVKPSEFASNTNNILKKMFEECFIKEYVTLIEGDASVSNSLLDEKFALIFFTGSERVARLIYQKAALNLSPIILELGGKSPCIIDNDADIKYAAKAIVFGKFLNLGQTCVAPDYIYCPKSLKQSLIEALKSEITLQFKDALNNPDYGRIINEKHLKRLITLIDKRFDVIGGRYDIKELKIEPTLLIDVSESDLIMQDEIFGPLLPILTYDNFDELINILKAKPKSLALYIFSKNQRHIDRLIESIEYGGGCINDCIMHLANNNLPFGGIGESGIGKYHGKAGFDAFSHYKSIVAKKHSFDLPMRYQPYKDFYYKLIHFIKP